MTPAPRTNTKVSIVTVVFNRQRTIAEAIRSVVEQTYPDVEHVIVDGASTDGTLDEIRNTVSDNAVLVSEPDEGVYDALNKGIEIATGDVIGIMHSDDYFADRTVLERVADAFSCESVDAVFGDLDYVDSEDTRKIVRRWRTGTFSERALRAGWMPPHPTLFLRKEVFQRYGKYDTQFKISADYDAILRYFFQGRVKSMYLPVVMVKMRVGGQSNVSIKNILRKSVEDYRALRRNEVGGILALILKNIRKLPQFFS